MAIGIVLAFFLAGCASAFTSSTEIKYVTADGQTFEYKSDKEHAGLEVLLQKDETGKVTGLIIKIDKSGTPEAVTAAALASQVKMIDLLGSALKVAGKIP